MSVSPTTSPAPDSPDTGASPAAPANPLAVHVGKHPGEPNVMEPALLTDPFTGYGELREQGAVVRGRFIDDTPVWFLTRFEEVREALRDPRFANNPAVAEKGASGETPFTRLMPAANSGLSRPESAASWARRRTAASC